MWKSTAGWLLWLFGAGLLYLFENNTATRILLLMSLFIPPMTALWTRAAARRLRCTLSAPERCAKNTQTACALQVYSGFGAVYLSGTLRCRNLLTGETALLPFCFSLRRGENTLPLSLCTAHCGKLELTLSGLCTQGLLGIGTHRFHSDAQAAVVVSPSPFLPQIRFAESVTVSLDSEQYSTDRPGCDPSETFSIREYQPGDPIRQIHWKLSQKTGRTMLRELGLPVVEQTLLLFDGNVPQEGLPVAPEVLDTMAEIFLSLSHALCVQGVAHQLAWINPQTRRLEWAQAGQEADFAALAERFLGSAGSHAGISLIQSFRALFPSGIYAHTALVCAHTPPDCGVLCMENRVSLFLPEGEPTPPGAIAVPFLPGAAEDRLNFVEL